MKGKRSIALLLMLLMVLLTFAGCGSSGNGGGSGEGEARTNLVIGIGSEPQSLDTHYTFDAAAKQVCVQIYDPLVSISDEGQAEPRLAESWTLSEDGLTYTFKLVENASFTSGRPFNAESAKANLERGLESPYRKSMLKQIKEINVLGEYELEIVLSEVYGPFLKGLSALGIVDIEAAEEAGADEFARNPVGTGPYKLKAWETGEKVILEANDDYFRGAPSIKELEFKIIPNSNTMLIALENGEIDVATDIDSMDIPDVEANEALQLKETPMTFVESLLINCEKEPFNDPLVRRAILMCIDKQSIIDVAFDGRAMIADQPITPYQYGYSSTFKPTERNIEEAKKLLTEAGYPDGFSCTITAMEGFRKKTAEVIQSNLKEIGITAEIELLEFGTMLDEGAAGNFELYVMEAGEGCYEGFYIILYQFHTDLWGEAGNYGRFGNKEMDKLIDAAPGEVDPEKSLEIYNRIIEIQDEEAYGVPLFIRYSNIAGNANLDGLYAHSMGRVEYYRFSWK
ncbi:MAG: ABC transporter substrate-binding protein [Lachnospiraceae bacterium]|nr:ABC transporter substrate-binding protein [Lachnospiraceae bacterium]